MTDENNPAEVKQIRKQTEDSQQQILTTSLNFEGLRAERLSSIDNAENNNIPIP